MPAMDSYGGNKHSCQEPQRGTSGRWSDGRIRPRCLVVHEETWCSLALSGALCRYLAVEIKDWKQWNSWSQQLWFILFQDDWVWMYLNCSDFLVPPLMISLAFYENKSIWFLAMPSTFGTFDSCLWHLCAHDWVDWALAEGLTDSPWWSVPLMNLMGTLWPDGRMPGTDWCGWRWTNKWLLMR